MVSRHEFLGWLHEQMRPITYLEIGVQYGYSINLAVYSAMTIGIDPQPLIPDANHILLRMTSDEFFAHADPWYVERPTPERYHIPPVNLAFIDGMHLFEYALRDFCNLERFVQPGSLIVFDDVLPRNQHEARRLAPEDPVHGDWTGDVWKITGFLQINRPNLKYWLINTEPTGLLVVGGFPEQYIPWSPSGDQIDQLSAQYNVPQSVIDRADTHQPEMAFELIKEALQCRS